MESEEGEVNELESEVTESFSPDENVASSGVNTNDGDATPGGYDAGQEVKKRKADAADKSPAYDANSSAYDCAEDDHDYWSWDHNDEFRWPIVIRFTSKYFNQFIELCKDLGLINPAIPAITFYELMRPKIWKKVSNQSRSQVRISN